MLALNGFAVTGNNNILTCSYILKQYSNSDLSVGFTFNFFMFLTVLLLKIYFNRNKNIYLNNKYKHEPFIIKCMINCSVFYIIRKKFSFKVKFLINKIITKLKSIFNNNKI